MLTCPFCFAPVSLDLGLQRYNVFLSGKMFFDFFLNSLNDFKISNLTHRLNAHLRSFLLSNWDCKSINYF